MIPDVTPYVKCITVRIPPCRVSPAGQPVHLVSPAPEARKASLVNIGLAALSAGQWAEVDAITQQIRRGGLRHA